MTKLKNTKKGMAKKALSISLVAAMLATSNVPVWAAEDLFSDNSVAIEAEVDDVVDETEVFSSDEATTTEPAPAIDQTEEDVNATLYTAGERFDFSDLQYVTNIDWGYKNKSPFTSGKIKNEDGADIQAGELYFKWQLDGIDLNGTEKDAKDILTQPKFSIDQSHIGEELTAVFYEKTGTPITIVKTISLGKIQAKDISNGMSINAIRVPVSYDGKTIEKKFGDNNLTVTDSALTSYAKADNFTWDYSSSNGANVGTVTVTATLKDSVAADIGYTGSLTQTYEIVAATTLPDVDVTVNNKAAGEFTGEVITLDPSSVTVKLKDTDIVLPVKAVKTDAATVGENGLVITLDKDKLNATKNFNVTADQSVTTTNEKAVISARALNKGTAALNVTYSVSDMKAGFKVNGKRITLTSADGKTITADKLGNKIIISLQEDPAKYAAVGTYKNAIIIQAADTSATPSVTGTVYADLVVTKKNFDADKATFKNAAKLGLKTTAKDAMDATSAVEYTGKEVEFTEDQLGSFLPNGDGNESDSNSFSITYKNNKDASTYNNVASLTIAGKSGSDYEGCTKTFYFKINPADITATNDVKTTDVTTAVKDTVKGIEYIENATAESYKDSIGLALRAQNDKTDINKEIATFALVDGTDYNCAYEFVSDADGTALDENSDPNTVGQYVKVTATVKNENYAVADATATVNGVKVVGNSAKSTITAYVKIVAKTIEGVDITFDKDEYVYTGENIKPVVTVKSGTKTLKEGTDYTVTIRNGINVGTATAVITALADSGFRPGSQITKEFKIVKANAEDVVVTFTTKTSGTVIKYDGESWNDKRLNYTVKLNGVDVAKQFKATWGENIDAGKTAGKLTLTPNANGAKNFDGIKEATFEIKGETLKGTLSVYDDNGTKISNSNGTLEFNADYTGSPITFAKTKFVEKNGKKLVEGKDYEITYIDNTASGLAYICVTGKGNYVGKAEQYSSDTKKTVDNIVDGTIYSFYIDGKEFAAKDVTFKNGVYASGLVVKPDVTIVKGNKTLVEGIDFEINVDAGYDAINATTENNIRFSIKGLGEYNTTELYTDATGKYLVFGIDKFDLANATVSSDGKTVTVRNGNVIVSPDEYTYEIKDGKVTVTATVDNKNYKGTKTIDVTAEDTFVEAPVINDVKVVGNKATVTLEGEAEGATGYDYVISKSKVFSDKVSRVGVNANVLSTQTTFRYVDQGIYYAYLHAWKRGADGKKIFSAWSNAYPFSVSSITPDQPTVTSVKVSGKTVKVTYTKAANATGYDLVLGSRVKKVYGEKRPVEYGKLVKKVYKGNTVTATFTNVPKGTYYAGLHAYNRTSENNGKVFSPWSNTRKVTVK